MFKITISDYVNHHPSRDRNGGNYAFFEEAIVTDGGEIVDGEHSTSAEFPYCECCGTFNVGSCCDGVYEPSRNMRQIAAMLADGNNEDEINAQLWPKNKKVGCEIEEVQEENKEIEK
jgi:hypothetical protein